MAYAEIIANLSSIAGTVGIIFFFIGVYAVEKGNNALRIVVHFWGVIFLTLSAGMTAVINGDISYVVMQIVFIATVVPAWCNHTFGTKIVPLKWFQVGLFGSVLFLIGGVINPGDLHLLQMMFAAITAVGIALAGEAKPKASLLTMGVGRFGLFATSAAKIYFIAPSPAAIVWAILMFFLSLESIRRFWLMRQRDRAILAGQSA